MNEDKPSRDLIEYLQHVETKLLDLIKCTPLIGNLSNLRDALFYAVYIAKRCDKKNLWNRGNKSRSARTQRILQPKQVHVLPNELPLPDNHFHLPGAKKIVTDDNFSLRNWDKLILCWYRKEKPTLTNREEKRSMLHFAANYGSVEFVKRLLMAGVSVREDQQGLSPIMWACHANRLDNLCVLDAHVRKINQVSWMYAPDRHGWAPIHHALHSNRGYECFEYVIRHYGANIVDKLGRTVLHHAALQGNLTLCQLIFQYTDSGIVNAVDEHGRTALHLATLCGHGYVVQQLLMHHANPELCDAHGHSALTYARGQRLHFCSHLLSKHAHSKSTTQAEPDLPTELRQFRHGIGPELSHSVIQLTNRQKHSSMGSSSESIELSRDRWVHHDLHQSATKSKQNGKTNYEQQEDNRRISNDSGSLNLSVKSLVYLHPNNETLYQTPENVTLQNEVDSIQNTLTRPPTPVPLPRGKSTRRSQGKSAKSHSCQSLTTIQPNSLTARQTAHTSNTVDIQEPNSMLNGSALTTKRAYTPCPSPLLVATPTAPIENRSTVQSVIQSGQRARVESAQLQRNQLPNSDISDVDQLMEVQQVVRIPARPYRTGSRRLRSARTVCNAIDVKLRESSQKKIEPAKLRHASSCSSLSEHDHQAHLDLPSRSGTGSVHVKLNGHMPQNSDLWTGVANGDECMGTPPAGRLLKRTQAKWKFGSLKKLFVRREKATNHGSVVTGLPPAVPHPLVKDYVENPCESRITIPPKCTTNLKTTGPSMRQPLLTPSADQLTRRPSTRNVKR